MSLFESQIERPSGVTPKSPLRRVGKASSNTEQAHTGQLRFVGLPRMRYHHMLLQQYPRGSPLHFERTQTAGTTCIFETCRYEISRVPSYVTGVAAHQFQVIISGRLRCSKVWEYAQLNFEGVCFISLHYDLAALGRNRFLY